MMKLRVRLLSFLDQDAIINRLEAEAELAGLLPGELWLLQPFDPRTIQSWRDGTRRPTLENLQTIQAHINDLIRDRYPDAEYVHVKR